MDQNTLDQIRFCAFCPNICRIYYPTTGLPQKESLSSSALAYLGHAVISGFIEYTPEVDALLNGMEGAQHCREACPYHYDIPVCLDTLRKEYLHNRETTQ